MAAARKRRELTRYDRPILIHLCKDGTLTYRTREQAVFNGRALPIASVNTSAEAEAVLVHFGKKQWNRHPQLPTQAWYKLGVLPDGRQLGEARPDGLEFEDIEPISDMVEKFIVEKLGVRHGS